VDKAIVLVDKRNGVVSFEISECLQARQMVLLSELIDEYHEPFEFVGGVIHNQVNLIFPKV
jgi:hypothetical protein